MTAAEAHEPEHGHEKDHDHEASASASTSCSLKDQPSDMPPADLREKDVQYSSEGETVLPVEPVEPESNESSDDLEETKYPHGAVLAGINLALVICIFVTSLDNTIIVTAIPKITDQFHSISEVSWYGSSYYLTNGAFQAAWGKVYKYFSIKYTFVLSLFMFELGSFISGISPNPVAFIFGRAISGLGSAGINTGSYIIIAHIVEPRKRPAYIGLIGFFFSIASVLGPLIGGAFTDKVTWRWCFYVNLPVGGVAGAMIVVLVHINAKPAVATWKEKLLQLDIVGITLFMGFCCCFLLAMQWGGQTKAWSSSEIIGLLVGFVVLAIAFVLWEAYLGERAMIIPRIWKKRRIYLSALFSLSFGGCFFLSLYYIPIYFQSVKNTTAIESAVSNLPSIIAFGIFSTLSGIIISATGAIDIVQVVAAAVGTIGVGLLFTLDVGSQAGKWITFQIIAGIGWGFGLQTGIMRSQIGMPMEDISCASSTVLTFLFLGVTFLVSAGQAAFVNTIGRHLARDAPDIELSTVIATGATELRQVFSGPELPAVINAYMQGIKVVFGIGIASAGLGLVCSLCSGWKSTARRELMAAKKKKSEA